MLLANYTLMWTSALSFNFNANTHCYTCCTFSRIEITVTPTNRFEIHINLQYFPGTKPTMMFLRKIRAKLKYKTEQDILTAGEWQLILSSQVGHGVGYWRGVAAHTELTGRAWCRAQVGHGVRHR